MKRLQYEIRKGGKNWGLYLRGHRTVLWVDASKRELTLVAAHLLTNAWLDLRIPSELTIKRANGTIQDKRTYGNDPRRTKG
jgi:hypothetical protein